MAQEKKKRKVTKSKFTKKRVETIVETMARTGSNRSAYEAAGVAQSTYFLWQKENEEFFLAVEKARTLFLDRNSAIMRSLAKNALYDVLLHGTKSVRENIVQEPDKEGELVVVERKVTTTRSGPPQWAIERVLGRSVDELDAVKKLIESEWLEPQAALEIPSRLEELNEDVRDILKRNIL